MSPWRRGACQRQTVNDLDLARIGIFTEIRELESEVTDPASTHDRASTPEQLVIVIVSSERLADRQMPWPPPSGNTAASWASAESVSSNLKKLCALPPGALMMRALFMISHFAEGETGILTVASISAFS